MEQVLCACGCGQRRPRYDGRGRELRYIIGHQNRTQTQKQRDASIATLARVRPRIPWNKGKTYVHASKEEYANKGSWNAAMRRLYPDVCMRCGWQEASCDTHHIIPKSEGGCYSIKNGIILCPNCHRIADVGILSPDELRTIKQNAEVVGMAV